MVLKRKTVTKVARAVKANSTRKVVARGVAAKTAGLAAKAEKKEEVIGDEEMSEEVSEEESEAELVASRVGKKPAAAQKKSEVEESDAEDEEESEEEEEQEEEADAQIVAFEKKEVSEQDVVTERTKELKSMPAEALKGLIASCGLEKGTKEVMIKTMLKHEAKVRAIANEQKAKIRGVVVKKKQELEALSIPELGKLCNDKGLKGLKSKPERVQRLLVQWQEEDGVDKALAEIALELRQKELTSMDDTKLGKLCNKLGVDPFVQEIMVERISKSENARGFYSRPAFQEVQKTSQEEKRDMVDALLANEAQRKKEQELRDKQEEDLLRKRRELKTLSAEDLKKRLIKKCVESTGKREDMVEALLIAGVREDAASARKSELQSKSTQDLQEMALRNKLEPGSKDQMVKAMLAHEEKCREDLKVFEAKVGQEAAKKVEKLQGQTLAALKELCESKGLPVKGDKDERIERIIEEAKKEREFDSIVSASMRSKRKEELMSKDKSLVLKLCEEKDIDPFVKDIMVERIMAHESEAVEAIAAMDEQPAAKKARVSKK